MTIAIFQHISQNRNLLDTPGIIFRLIELLVIIHTLELNTENGN